MALHKFLTFLLCFICFFVSAQDAKTYKKLGDKYYASAKYQEALDAYLNYHETRATDIEVKQKIGVCYYFTNNINKAKNFLTYVVENEKKPAPDVYFFLGRSYQAQNDFKKAAEFYKEFLRNIPEDNINRPLVKDAIRRCANGLRLSGRKASVIVENMGEKVNSVGDDFRPILSPNFDDKLYFSSVRAGNLGGLRDEQGYEDLEVGKYCSDMYSTTVINGEWTATQPMSFLLNSPRHDMILDFSERGDQMFFFKGYTQYSGRMLVDTFKRIEERSLFATDFDGPIEARKGDCAPHFYNDTILLFASRRPGGFGGLDLYISKKKNGEWTKGENLGATINSAYDESTPFLAKDGRTLYFSSNRADKSMGGYDIFTTNFIDRKQEWTEPQNMRIPVNSSGDDKDFRLANDGYKAFFSSSRKEGLGQNDLYVGYFKEYRTEARAHAQLNTFIDVLESKRAAEQIASQINGADTPVFTQEELKTYKIEPLFYESNGDVMTLKNTAKLKKLTKLAAEHPELKFVLTAHSDGSDPVEFDLYFSVKKAEAAAEYLTKQGIEPSRITVAGYGSAFPIAKNEINGIENVIGKRLNRRIDVAVQDAEGLPIVLDYEDPEVAKQMKTLNAKLLKNSVKGLSYKVQIASFKQMYKGDLIFKYPNAMVESTGDLDAYRYTVGRYKTFSSADQLREDLKRQGVADAYVVAYIDGRRISKTQAADYLEKYPDLANLITSENINE